jgi:hypothetical protein
MNNKTIVFRIESDTAIRYLLIAAIAVMGLVGGHYCFGQKVYYEETSISPDGMYKYRLRGIRRMIGNSLATVAVYKCKTRSNAGKARLCKWELIADEQIGYDSIDASPAAAWNCNNEHRTRALRVWLGAPWPNRGDLSIPLD